MDGRQSGRRSGLGLRPAATPPGPTQGTAAGTPGVVARAMMMGNAFATLATTTGIYMTILGIRRCRRPTARPCPVEAPSDAPGPSPRRILVFLYCCSRWSMVLAGAAACWGLVEVVMRSGPHDRAGPLGSFPVDFDFVLDLPIANAALGALLLISASAIVHPCPEGPACVAPPVSRTVVILAGLRLPIGMRSGPRARACASDCSASSSIAWSGAPLLSSGGAGATRARRAPRAAAFGGGIPRNSTLSCGARLAARVTAGPPCLPASAEASS